MQAKQVPLIEINPTQLLFRHVIKKTYTGCSIYIKQAN